MGFQLSGNTATFKTSKEVGLSIQKQYSSLLLRKEEKSVADRTTEKDNGFKSSFISGSFAEAVA